MIHENDREDMLNKKIKKKKKLEKKNFQPTISP